MKILVIKYRNIGDVLLSTPLIDNIAYYYPGAEIDFALNDYCESMVKNNPNIKKIFLYKRDYLKSLKIVHRLIEEFKYFRNIILNNYDIIINLTEGERGAYISLFSFNTKFKLGYQLENKFLKFLNPYTKTLSKQAIHTVKNDLGFLKLLDKSIVSNKVSIYWDKNDEDIVNNFLEDNNKNSTFIQIHPVSRWMFKCWDDKKFAEIIDYIKIEKGYNVIITASPDKVEKDKVDNILNYCKSTPINLSGKLTLNQLAYLSSISKIFIGIDSAPMHISAAVDTPVIALFGASYPNIWAPWNNYTINNYEFKDGVQKVGIHTIFSSTNQKIYTQNGVKFSKGMMNIKLEDIRGIINEYI